MLYKVRICHGQPDKLRALLDHLETVTLAIWDRFGIRQAGFRIMPIGESNQQLLLLLAHNSLAKRIEKWSSFTNDPEPQAKRAKIEGNGPLLTHVSNPILQPTVF